MMNQMSFNNMNFFNPMMNHNFVNNNNQFQQMIQQQLIQMQQIMQQQRQQQIQQEEMLMKQQIENQNQSITVWFRSGRREVPKNAYSIECRMKDKISVVIERYRNKSADREEKKFISNAINLNPNQTVEEAGLCNNSNIYVFEYEGVKGG